MAPFTALPPAPFTLTEAREAIGWPASNRALADRLRDLGYVAYRMRKAGSTGTERVWKPDPNSTALPCACRCHTGTCGENDMVMAERTIRLVERLRPMSRDFVDAIDDLVQRAGVDFARASTGTYPTDDDVPF